MEELVPAMSWHESSDDWVEEVAHFSLAVEQELVCLTVCLAIHKIEVFECVAGHVWEEVEEVYFLD